MDTIKVLSIIAGTASLASGVTSVILGKLANRPLRDTHRTSRRAELQATAKELRSSLVLSRSGLNRLRLVFWVACTYTVTSIAALLLADTNDGPMTKAIYIVSVIMALLLGGLLLAAILYGYRSIQTRQNHLDQKMEEVSRMVHR
jgi:hypothetical protein